MSVYRSYSGRNGRGAPLGDDRGGRLLRERVRNVLLLLCLVALIVSLVIGLPAIRFQRETRSVFISRLQNDCNAAQALASRNLSRTAGTSSALTIGQLRGYVYGMDTVNQLYNTQMGGSSYLVDSSQFTAIYNSLDSFSNMLTTGTDTSVLANELILELTSLSETVNALQ